MTTRSPEQVYATLIQAGWPPAGAVIMTAIAGAESGYDDQNVGDVSLENATYGPSIGLFQIRTEKAATGTGGNRDQLYLAASDLNQAKAALAISNGGTNFGPWTTYTSGAYQKFLSGAQGAASTVGSNISKWVSGLLGPAGAVAAGIGSAIGGAGTSTLDSVVTPILEGSKTILYTVAFVGLGGLLVIAGAYVSARPAIKKSDAKVKQGVETAAKVV